MTHDSRRPVRIGVQIKPQHADYAQIRRACAAAEDGFPFGTPAERASQLEAGLARIGRRLAALNPPPVRKIPILVAGAGERKTLALAARHADIWNALLPDAESYQRKSRLLDEHCALIGRDPASSNDRCWWPGRRRISGNSTWPWAPRCSSSS